MKSSCYFILAMVLILAVVDIAAASVEVQEDVVNNVLENFQGELLEQLDPELLAREATLAKLQVKLTKARRQLADYTSEGNGIASNKNQVDDLMAKISKIEQDIVFVNNPEAKAAAKLERLQRKQQNLLTEISAAESEMESLTANGEDVTSVSSLLIGLRADAAKVTRKMELSKMSPEERAATKTAEKTAEIQRQREAIDALPLNSKKRAAMLAKLNKKEKSFALSLMTPDEQATKKLNKVTPLEKQRMKVDKLKIKLSIEESKLQELEALAAFGELHVEEAISQMEQSTSNDLSLSDDVDATEIPVSENADSSSPISDNNEETSSSVDEEVSSE